MWGSDRSGSDREPRFGWTVSYNRPCQLVATSSPAPSVSSAPPPCPPRPRQSSRPPSLVAGPRARRQRPRSRRRHRHRPARHRRDARAPTPRRRRDRRHLRRLRAQPGEGRRSRPDRREACRLPAHPRRQEHRRRRHRHARSLARADDRARLPGRQGRLRREADLGGHRRRPRDGAGGAQVQPHRPGRHAAALAAALPAGRRDREERRPRRRHAGPLLERRQRQGDRQPARRRAARRPRLGPVARPGAEGAVQPEPLRRGARRVVALPLVLGLRRRHDDRLGRAPDRHRADGDERRRAARGVDDRRQVPPRPTTATRRTPSSRRIAIPIS